MLTCLVPVLFTYYIQNVLKFKNKSGAKGLSHSRRHFDTSRNLGWSVDLAVIYANSFGYVGTYGPLITVGISVLEGTKGAYIYTPHT